MRNGWRTFAYGLCAIVVGMDGASLALALGGALVPPPAIFSESMGANIAGWVFAILLLLAAVLLATQAFNGGRIKVNAEGRRFYAFKLRPGKRWLSWSGDEHAVSLKLLKGLAQKHNGPEKSDTVPLGTEQPVSRGQAFLVSSGHDTLWLAEMESEGRQAVEAAQ